MASPYLDVCFVAPLAYPLLAGDNSIEVIGGAELQVVIVARELAARGHRVSMICLDYGQHDEIEIQGIKVYRAYKPDEGIRVLRFLYPRLTSIWSCLKRADANIYYQQTAGILTGVMAAFCKRYDKKSVFAAASNPDLFVNTPRIKFARDRWMYSYGLRQVDRIFVQNAEQADLCRRNFGRSSVLVPNCYPVSDVHAVGSGGTFILWVSTIRKLKRPELFLDLAEALPDYQFRMIGGPGDGEASLFESTKARARTIKNVQFYGFVPFEQTERHFDQATLLVNTSDSEGFPNAFLQAWARGIPTVSFVDAGARLDGEAVGLRARSFDELVATVSAMAASNSSRLKEGGRGERYVTLNHSPMRILELYEKSFGELVEPPLSVSEDSSTRPKGAECGDSER